jgi:hypothetical protein
MGAWHDRSSDRNVAVLLDRCPVGLLNKLTMDSS